jgi:tetratricopeptide (TPR) repeat protein
MNVHCGIMIVVAVLAAAGCNSELIERQGEQIRQQEGEIARQRKELDSMLAGQKLLDQKQQDCNRAFRDYFEKAQAMKDRDQIIALYRKGLELCADDEVAHYELGRALAESGRNAEAEKEFAAALKINPSFGDAQRQLDAVRKNR